MSAAKKICVLASGGMDSCILVTDLLRRGLEVHPLYVQSGFRWERVELSWLRRFLRAIKDPKLKPLTVARAPMAGILESHWSLGGKGVPPLGSRWDSVYLPGRNLILLSQAAVLCLQRGLGAMALATLKGNPFPDAASPFRRRLEKAFQSGLGRRVSIEAPFSGLTKKRVLALARGLPLRLTFSCLDPRGRKHCGACSKCEERMALGL